MVTRVATDGERCLGCGSTAAVLVREIRPGFWYPQCAACDGAVPKLLRDGETRAARPKDMRRAA